MVQLYTWLIIVRRNAPRAVPLIGTKISLIITTASLSQGSYVRSNRSNISIGLIGRIKGTKQNVDTYRNVIKSWSKAFKRSPKPRKPWWDRPVWACVRVDGKSYLSLILNRLNYIHHASIILENNYSGGRVLVATRVQRSLFCMVT